MLLHAVRSTVNNQLFRLNGNKLMTGANSLLAMLLNKDALQLQAPAVHVTVHALGSLTNMENH